MRVNQCIGCKDFPCTDVRHDCYTVPDVEVQPDKIRIVLISEAAPADPADYYYAAGDPLFQQTTVQAFQDAGAAVESVQDILDLGVYLTTAVKCGKTGYGIQAAHDRRVLAHPGAGVGAFSQRASLPADGRRGHQGRERDSQARRPPRVIPAGSTYKLRGPAYTFQGKRAFPSYLQAGPSFFIEKSKRQMIAEDIAAALSLIPSSLMR